MVLHGDTCGFMKFVSAVQSKAAACTLRRMNEKSWAGRSARSQPAHGGQQIAWHIRSSEPRHAVQSVLQVHTTSGGWIKMDSPARRRGGAAISTCHVLISPLSYLLSLIHRGCG